MKNLGTFLAALCVAVVLFLYMCTFQVRFTETAIVKTWGKPASDALDEPGLKFKWPSPIQTVVVYDKRIRVLEDRTEETRTVDGKNLILTTFTLWRIVEPGTFHTNFPDGIATGEKKLRATIVSAKHAVVGKRRMDEFISTNAETRKLREIEQTIQASIAEGVETQYGVEIMDFGIAKLGLPRTVTTAIFASMKSKVEQDAATYRAEGEARAAEILADAQAKGNRIMAAVSRKVSEIRAEAQRVVGQYYSRFDEHPALRIYLDKLRGVQEALKVNSTLIIDTSEAPFDIFDAEKRAEVAASVNTTPVKEK